MNREIKFRVWDREFAEMVYDLNITFTTWGHVLVECDTGEEEGVRILNSDLNQYTGLKDKNGVEIYEGDIIIHDDSDIGGFKDIYEVVWNDEYTLDSPAFGLWCNRGYRRFDLGYLEVIGNIYENPELFGVE